MKPNDFLGHGYSKKSAGVACRVFGQAMGAGEVDKDSTIIIADSISKCPEHYLTFKSGRWSEVAKAILEDWAQPTFEWPDVPAPYAVWGEDQIEEGAIEQMANSCSLPVAIRGALMPDAHQGYGLPIGGVLATENAVIPFAVGVDIACRMRLSVLDFPAETLKTRIEDLKQAINRETRFGLGCKFQGNDKRKHNVLDENWNISKVTRRVKDRSWEQLGTSGGGNHFVEFGIYTGPTGTKRLALLSHSGSRGAGSNIAKFYTDIAMAKHPELPDELKHLAWLDLDSHEGMEYWEAMQLMGKYAAANHQCIHDSVIGSIGAQVTMCVENHHNFAWKEEHDGKEVIVHRKGATPAGLGVQGIIPGSMASACYVVSGLGNADSLNSAAHGAGRRMSRKKAKATFNWSDVQAHLKHKGVELMSAGIDEVPMAYKNIDDVMAAQTDLVEIVGRFDPKLVKMAGVKE